MAILLFPLVSLSEVSIERKDVVSWPEWYLDKNLLDMTPENRFVGTVNLQNPGATPVHVRATVKRISLAGNGQREIVKDETQTLRVFPDEMVLPPNGAFTARLLADTAKMSSDAQSYYIHFEDVTRLNLSGDGKSGGMAAGFLLAYDVMVAVHRQPRRELKEGDITFLRNPEGRLTLSNQSGQHIYLNRGYACPTDDTKLVECGEWPAFPKQTLLPGEIVTLEDPASAVPRYLGLLAYPLLDTRRSPNRFYLPVPARRSTR